MQTTRTVAAVICFLVVLLQAPAVPALEPLTIALSVATAIGGLAGGAGSLLFGDVIIAGKITVENWTKFRMFNHSILFGDGVVHGSVKDIAPGASTDFKVRKDRVTATGCYGTASWQMDFGGSKPEPWYLATQAVVMWSVPYDYNLYSNYLAVGTTTRSNGGSWFDQMYYGYVDNQGKGTWYTRKRYLHSVENTVHDNDRIEIQAQMGTGHDADVHVRVLPQHDVDLADSKREEAEALKLH